MNILKKADEIVNQRSEEKERNYGPFDQSMTKMRDIFNAMSGKDLTTEDMYYAMIALKFSRMNFSYQEDSMLDAVSYLGALNNYKEKERLIAHSIEMENKLNDLIDNRKNNTGRPVKFDNSIKIDVLYDLFFEKKTPKEIQEKYFISKPTYYKFIKEYEENMDYLKDEYEEFISNTKNNDIK